MSRGRKLMRSVALSFWLGLLLLAVYLLTFSGKLHIMDEFVGYAVGNNLVQHSRADVNQFIWTNHWHSTPPGLWGTDNNLYTKKAPGISLLAMPLIWLGHTFTGLNAVQMSLLTCALITALSGSLLLLWLLDLGFSRGVATATSLGYGLCSLALVYAHYLWEHAVVAATFLLAGWAVYRLVHRASPRRWWWLAGCSLAMALSLTLRFEAAMAVGVVGLYLFFGLPAPLTHLSGRHLLNSLREPARWLWLAAYGLLPGLTLLGLLYFNYIRFGSITETGYNREILFHRPWEGAIGLLVSPSTGLFIYAPLTLLIFFGLRPAWRRLPRPYLGLLLGLTVFYWLFYGSWFSWGSTWVWGPRFFLHTLPLLMLFVAAALAHLRQPPERSWLARPAGQRLALGTIALLALAGFFINFLGVAVDLNEHFLRLGRNDNYVFNWAAFPPLGHWQILLEGQTDLIWLSSGALSWTTRASMLLPPLILLGLALTGLGAALSWGDRSQRVTAAVDDQGSLPVNRITALATHPLSLLLAGCLTIGLIYGMMRATAQVPLATSQAQADAPLLEDLTARAAPGDPLWVAMPPFGDVQEFSTHLMAYLDHPLPTYAWIESEPKAIQPEERERLWQAATAQTEQLWLFERWLTPKDRLGQTRALLEQRAFPVWERWYEMSGRLTSYALPAGETPLTIPLNVSFQGGFQLREAAILTTELEAGQILKVRLTWHVDEPTLGSADGFASGGVIGFVQLIDQSSNQNLAQQDRLLFNVEQLDQSPLRPGQTVSQGYGLRLPEQAPPGSYPLVAGLYLANSGQRLPRTDGSPDDFLYLTNITLNPAPLAAGR